LEPRQSPASSPRLRPAARAYWKQSAALKQHWATGAEFIDGDFAAGALKAAASIASMFALA
jgi:hypothetical protein